MSSGWIMVSAGYLFSSLRNPHLGSSTGATKQVQLTPKMCRPSPSHQGGGLVYSLRWCWDQCRAMLGAPPLPLPPGLLDRRCVESRQGGAESGQRLGAWSLQSLRQVGGAESRRRRVPVVLTQALQSQVGTSQIMVRPRRRVQAAAPSSSGVDSSTAQSTQRRHQAASPSQGAAETRQRRKVQAMAPSPSCVDSSTAECTQRPDTRRQHQVKALQKPGGVAESRRRRVSAVLTQAPPSIRSANTRQLRRVKALQRPGHSQESRQRRVPAVLIHAAPSPGSADNR